MMLLVCVETLGVPILRSTAPVQGPIFDPLQTATDDASSAARNGSCKKAPALGRSPGPWPCTRYYHVRS